MKPHVKILIIKHRHLHQCTFEIFLKMITLYLRFFLIWGQKIVHTLKLKVILDLKVLYTS